MSRQVVIFAIVTLLPTAGVLAEEVDFNRDIRPILSNNCLLCHGPDEEGLEAGLRLDHRETATKELESGTTAIVPGKPDLSELIARVTIDDEDLRMPPPEHGAKLSDDQVELLRRWIKQGAKFAKHWSYTQPQKPTVPKPSEAFSDWPHNAVDSFVLRRLLEHGLEPSQEADRYVLARRVFLDLTGLPPTVEEVDAFVADQNPDAYERLVDDLLQRPTFGEHWARKWLDLARYADSAGYADDPPRTIWAYRDWVIRAMNDNMPFDQFTMEQLAGDLLHSPTESQLIATAFHRNTLTNNEGGTQDEEFRNVAVVDRVNTTMAVWMGTTMACAQCHTHKYDPITQEEYFKFFAIFNNTQDRDRRDESPTIPLFTDQQKQQRSRLAESIAALQKTIATPTPELTRSQQLWETSLKKEPVWRDLRAESAERSSGQDIRILDGGEVLVETETLEALPVKDNYTVEFSLSPGPAVAALRLSALPHESLPNKGSGHSGGNFVITGIHAHLIPTDDSSPTARFVRVTNKGSKQILSLAEVEVFSEGRNIAREGKATQHSTAYAGPAEYAIDGNRDGNYDSKSTTHTDTVDNPWWELDLGGVKPIESLTIWNRTDGNTGNRLKDFRIELLDDNREVIWVTDRKKAPSPSADFSPSNIREVEFTTAIADYHQPGFEPTDVLTGKTGQHDGWAIGGAQQEKHHLVLVPKRPIAVDEEIRLRVLIEHQSPHMRHLLGHFALSVTSDAVAIERSAMPASQLAILDQAPDKRSPEDAAALAQWFRANAAPELSKQRAELRQSQQKLAGIKPATSVPVFREITDKRRDTFLQFRGNYLDLGQRVSPGTPAIFHEPPQEITRKTLAQWLTSSDNPLTARVLANRYWETIFGRGIVVTSEEFGSQGELPTHPELLDWLALDVIEHGWDRKKLLRTLVTSATYRQSAVASPENISADPDNRWLSRGPRIRHSAEMVRDQALFAAGLLSSKMYGPPVKPPQPDMGLKAAFGGSTDWKTSSGEDRYRRGIYTTWRRSNPYPSMATFDAPNREVCTVRRNRTNTPLQSLVTLNDPAYVEAAQALARIALQTEGSVSQQIQVAFRRCLLRSAGEEELTALRSLFDDTKAGFSEQPEAAVSLATVPLGPLPEGLEATDAAAMTVVCNVLLNLDEMFLKR